MRSTSQKNKKNAEDLDLSLKQANQSRRSFAKAGILSPVIISLASRPAWGGANRCTVSGFDSAAEIGSGNPGTIETCKYTSIRAIRKGLTGPQKNEGINTLFDCLTVSDPIKTIDKALKGDYGEWIQFLVAAYYLALAGNNPFGTCPVADVFCHFEASSNSFNFGNFVLDKDQVLDFLKAVISKD